MSKEKEYLLLKKKVTDAQSGIDQSKGALQETMKALKTEFGCTTLAVARKKLATLNKKVKECETNYTEAKDTFEEEWASEDE